MGFFTKLEKLSEKYIEGFFRNKFADHIQPAEIAKLLLREMRDNKTVSVSAVYVPNEYTVYVGKEDWETIEPVRASLAGELEVFLKEKILEKEYRNVPEINVVFELEEELQLGAITVKSSFSKEPPDAGRSAGPEAAPLESTLVADRRSVYGLQGGPLSQDTLTRAGKRPHSPRAHLVLRSGAREDYRFPLGDYGVIIGRKRTNDIALEDTNISRVHASVDYLEGNYYLSDLGSTNGTYVNGNRISKKKLIEGDQIRMGKTILEFRVV